jgi:anti-sigma regulatory factor (Ser/Thr protein kinase)
MPDSERRPIEDYLDRVIELADDEADELLLNEISAHPRDIVKHASEKLGISRQAIHQRLKRLVADGRVLASGTTRNRTYALGPFGVHTLRIPVTEELQEDEVLRRFAEPRLVGLPDNIRRICAYGFTEILNNVKDHSGSPIALITLERTPTQVSITIIDQGVGIFRRIREGLGLATEHQAAQELVKGKVTTDPERHTGEGIFFTARMHDRFSIISGRIALMCSSGEDDWTIESGEERGGSAVLMSISTSTDRTMEDVFAKYAGPSRNHEFSHTHLGLHLFEESKSTGLISRSQAKRVLARMERFRSVVLDFDGVDSIGPAFADEMFRVFARSHPQILLIPVNANERVASMIARAQKAQSEQSPEVS